MKAIVGIDLAGNPKNPTGFAAIKPSLTVEVCLVFNNEDIIKKVERTDPSLVAIDAPLTLPKGRCCFKLSCNCKTRGANLRVADREMIKLGYRVFPPAFGGMRTLTMRGIELSKILHTKNFKVIEVHPRSSKLALKLPIENSQKLQNKLTKLGLKGEILKRKLSDDELDAIIAALTGYLNLKNQTETIGEPDEGQIIIPKTNAKLKYAKFSKLF